MLRRAAISLRGYAQVRPGKTAVGAPSMQSQRIKHPVETDPVKLATYCCGSNIKQTGEDVKLGADEDYPQWLWEMHLGRPLDPHELSPETEEYWARVHKLACLHQGRLRSKATKEEMRINEKHKLALLAKVVHRALAFKHHDPGYDLDRGARERYRKYGPLA
ncbi:39S ribosomal protein L54, mitochondrial [Galendromus occidentalis]|uniref:Large ribosomal subunit protein mL54 n=1 Tax=Galendromus occidentalis TaxID=34638 RepID=A0AAJ6VYH4_9ACAR|nr:39S ribosomal protein L54, mitochondrial [Galendromus occidentalis]